MFINKKERIYHLVDFTFSADEKYKIKDIYLVIVREMRKLHNMGVIVIPVIISALRTVPKGLVIGLTEFEIRNRVCFFSLMAYQHS